MKERAGGDLRGQRRCACHTPSCALPYLQLPNHTTHGTQPTRTCSLARPPSRTRHRRGKVFVFAPRVTSAAAMGCQPKAKLSAPQCRSVVRGRGGWRSQGGGEGSGCWKTGDRDGGGKSARRDARWCGVLCVLPMRRSSCLRISHTQCRPCLCAFA